MSVLRRAGVLLSVLGLGAAAVTLVPAAATAAPITPPAVTAGKTYVALGDSYAAGFGIPTTAMTPDGKNVSATRPDAPLCRQTSGDYPHILATQLGLTLTDVTCSGAETKDFANAQTTDAGAQVAPPQLDVFNKIKPDLVTITIGGNDFQFVPIAQDCFNSAAKNGKLVFHATVNVSTCQDYYKSIGKDPAALLPTVLANVAKAIAAVQAAAPNAKIAVIAYPAIAPDTTNTVGGSCFTANALGFQFPLPNTNGLFITSAFPFADADVPYLQTLQQRLVDGIASVAKTAGVGYADIYPSSLSHSACQPESSRWVEPVLPDQQKAPTSSNVLHPNVAGTTAMAAALAPVVTALLAPPATTSPAPSTGATTSAAAGSTQAAGTAPLANTGPGVPVAWLLGLAGVLLLSGGVALGAARQKRTAQH